MAMYETEEEQIEALKKWWADNGRAVMLGLLLGVALILGWRFWGDHQRTQAEEASSLYESLIEGMGAESDAAALLSLQTQLGRDYADTPYASLAALAMAKLYVSQHDLKAAQRQLSWVLENEADENLGQVARLRLGRILLAVGEKEKALTLAKAPYAEAFLADVAELQGDALLALGRLDEARLAYQEALSAPMAIGDRQGLQMKYDDLKGVQAADSAS
ncbi:MAG: tetratricopeptide repeat protein [Gammaproteobacteria bacterium]|nr:tetratricopeptide repeat protein [Gammaproteobacteria bacterium]